MVNSSAICEECPICYFEMESPQIIKLRCGHSYHKDCLKKWYLKGVSGTNCPMCRSNIYFSRCTKILGKWEEEREEVRMNESFTNELSNLFDSYEIVFDEINNEVDESKKKTETSEMWEVVAEDLVEVLKDYFDTMRDCGDDPDLFEEVINDPYMRIFTQIYKSYYINPYKRFIENMFIGKNTYGVIMNKCNSF